MSSWQESRGHALLHGGFTQGTHSGNLVFEGLDETLQKIENLYSTNPNMEKTLKKIVRKILLKVTQLTRKSAKSIVGQGYPNSFGDRRRAYMAVKSMVYKRILGGNVSILSKRKRGKYAASLPENTVIGSNKRGGNRRRRSQKTIDVMSYWGEDRGFILRFLSSGTDKRHISTSNNRKVNRFVGRGHTSASLNKFRNGNRGSIAARNWFGEASMENFEYVMKGIHEELEQIIREIWEGDTVASAANVKFN